ncbi:AraC family transcriptional regulator [Salinicola avicenniae]|uniref:AraC family transcriptional regulator n=1 Tax=Salinicola avicenniae TaxID=2916836 RepID=UPI0020749464|nr:MULTISPECIES: AraC family transcriptional regulator [unclassified Salinicola]
MTLDNDWCVVAPTTRIERIEARFHGHAYSMHRHDTFAIGITLSGVQSFHYRRGHRSSLPGTVIVIHPDEPHDGHAGNDSGFQYRMLYVSPALIQTMLNGEALPYVNGGLTRDANLQRAVSALLCSIDAPLDTLEEDNGLADLASALQANSDARGQRQRTTLDARAAHRVRDYLDLHYRHPVSLDELERMTDQPRWTLTRDFRALFGTSPYRYLTLRRLDFARQLITNGATLSDTALTAGFSDQSHLTRAFKQAFGVTPARWRSLLTGR